jgi:tripartite-type tricarboxylate transporter receptor subunit TctC
MRGIASLLAAAVGILAACGNVHAQINESARSYPRLPEYADLLTFNEAGVKNYEVNAWYSVHAPAGVQREIVVKVHRELVRILDLADIKERLKQLGSEGVGNTPEEFGKFVRTESVKYAKAIRQAGVKVE